MGGGVAGNDHVKVIGHAHALQQRFGEHARLVGDDAHFHAAGFPSLQAFQNARINLGKFAVDRSIVALEGFDGQMQLFSTRRLTVGQAALNQYGHALADEAVHFRLAARRLTDFFKHQTTPFSQISDGVEQGSIKVEGDGVKMHAVSHLSVVVSNGRGFRILLATGD